MIGKLNKYPNIKPVLECKTFEDAIAISRYRIEDVEFEISRAYADGGYGSQQALFYLSYSQEWLKKNISFFGLNDEKGFRTVENCVAYIDKQVKQKINKLNKWISANEVG